MKTLFVTLSAIPLSLVKPYVKSFNRTRYSHIFNKYGSGKGKNKNRIYIPVGNELKVEKAKVPALIAQELAEQGYEVENYTTGIAKQIAGKRSMRIGKLLTSDEAKKTFANDPARSASKVGSGDLIVVISQHPYDIAGMSFDRGWTSCMNLDAGIHKSYLVRDIKHGTLVAYLIKNTDKNINAPIARISLKPYVKSGNRKENILVMDGAYGTSMPAFSKVVEKFCSWANSGSSPGLYFLNPNLYRDGGSGMEVFGNVQPKDIAKNLWGRAMHHTKNMEAVKNFSDAGIITYVGANPYATTEILEYVFPKFIKATFGLRQDYVQNKNAPEHCKLVLLKSDSRLALYYSGSVNLKETADILMDNHKVPIHSMSKQVFLHCLSRAVLNSSIENFNRLLRLASNILPSWYLKKFGRVTLNSVPRLKEFIKEHGLENKCLEYRIFDASAYDIFFELSTLPVEEKAEKILISSGLPEQDLVKYVKLAPTDFSLINITSNLFFAIAKVRGVDSKLALAVMLEPDEVDLNILKMCWPHIQNTNTVETIVMYCENVDVVRYLANNVEEKIFWEVLALTNNEEFVKVQNAMPLAEQISKAKKYMSGSLADTLIRGDVPELQELGLDYLNSFN